MITFKGFLNFYLWKMTLRMLLVSENQAVQWLMHFSLNIVFDCFWWDHFSLEKLQTWDTLIRLSTSKLPSQQIIYRCNKMKSFHEESVLRHQMILWTNELKSYFLVHDFFHALPWKVPASLIGCYMKPYNSDSQFHSLEKQVQYLHDNVNLYTPTPRNGQKLSNNLSTNCLVSKWSHILWNRSKILQAFMTILWAIALIWD